MNQKSLSFRAKILQLLTEGNSIRGTARIMDCSVNTVMKLLVDVGQACQAYQDLVLVNLPCKRIEVDEIWSYVFAKRWAPPEVREVQSGVVWTWTAICPETKLVPCWVVGTRHAYAGTIFLQDLAKRMAGRIQLSSDGYGVYRDNVDFAFGSNVDFGMYAKSYKKRKDGSDGAFNGATRIKQSGNPDERYILTSFVERQNLTMRMSMRRFARSTNAFSKKIENHTYAIALHFMNYNFVRIHSSLRVTPAMAAGITDKLWELEDIVRLLDKPKAANNNSVFHKKERVSRPKKVKLTPRDPSLGDGSNYRRQHAGKK